MISTIGCQKHIDMFLQGFKEMKSALKPSLVIVYGDMVKGMTGRFVNYSMTECFDKKSGNNQLTQLRLFDFTPIFEIPEDVYGI